MNWREDNNMVAALQKRIASIILTVIKLMLCMYMGIYLWRTFSWGDCFYLMKRILLIEWIEVNLLMGFKCNSQCTLQLIRVVSKFMNEVLQLHFKTIYRCNFRRRITYTWIVIIIFCQTAPIYPIPWHLFNV